jgi:lipopolysaccharide transport system permease protein
MTASAEDVPRGSVLPSGPMATTTARPLRAARRPSSLGLIGEGLREIWSRRRLTGYLVRADLHKHGADTILGNVWWLLDPLLQMAVYVVLVSVIFKIQKPDYPLFVFCAILPWKWFATAVNDGIMSVTSRERIIKQVKFPKIVLPVSATLGGVVNFAFGLIPLFALMILFYSERISPTLLLIPLIAVVQFIFSLGLAIVVAAVNVFFRDIANVARHALRLWFYLSPALYQYSDVTHSDHGLLTTLFSLNPWTTLFESYRDVIYNGIQPAWGSLALLLLASCGLVAAATLFFKRLEPSFAKIL